MRSSNRLGLLAVVAGLAAGGQAATAQADFGAVDGSFTTALSGTQAGAAGDYTMSFAMKQKDPDNPSSEPDGTIRDLDLQLPKGLIADPTPWTACGMSQISDPSNPCPGTSAVGTVHFRIFFPAIHAPYFLPMNSRLYRVKTQGNEAAAFAFPIFGQFPVRLGVTVDPVNGYRIRSTSTNTNEAEPLLSADVTLWGTPEDHQGPGPFFELGSSDPNGYGGPLDPSEERHKFLSMPTRCGGTPLESTLSLRPWQTDLSPVSYSSLLAPVEGCDQLQFDPSIKVTPENREAGKPSGYQVDLNVPQNDDPEGLTTPNLKDAVVKLPEGVAISAPQADGLQACTDAQLDLQSAERENCPDAAKVGTIDIDTPLLDEPVKGSIYIATQQSNDPESGEMYRIFLTGKAPGVQIKLRGQIRADKNTGQLTATFQDNPELPFSKFSLNFKSGDRAALVNPPKCGTYTTTTQLSSWGGQNATPSDAFVIDQGCPTGQFAPTFTAGTTNAFAGGFSPFTMTVRRSDADQDLSSLKLDLPSGLLGALGSVPLCGEEQAAAGTCGPESRIGSTTVAVGTGGTPFSLPGTVSLGGPYKGAPFSLSVAVPAKAGPFDLGLVVVRAALNVDANNAKASAVTDPFPTIVGGVPIHMRMVNVALDRPGFIFNATSCAPTTIAGTFASVDGAGSGSTVPYQAQGCNQLKLQPKLSLKYTGKGEMLKGKHPGVEANLGAFFGQSNLKTVQVKLPLTASLDVDNAEALCEAADAAAGHCPATSQIGTASATTPSLHVPVQGPVYFVKGTRIAPSGKVVPTLPKLYLKLSGEGVTVDLHADSDVDSQKRLVTTFTNIPDVPITDFKLNIDSGKHGILEATNDVCSASKATTVLFTGQNGGKTQRNVAFTAPECGPQIVSLTSTSTTLTAHIGGISGGKLTLIGSRVGTVKRTIKSSDVATLKTRLTRSTRSALSHGKKVRVSVKVTYQPKKGKSVSFTKSLVVKGKKAKK